MPYDDQAALALWNSALHNVPSIPTTDALLLSCRCTLLLPRLTPARHRYVSDDDRAALNLVEFGSYSIPGDHSGSESSSSSSSTLRNRTLNSGVFAGPANTFASVASMDAVQQGDGTKVMPLPPYALRAGPREEIYFDPKTVTAAIISTGEENDWRVGFDPWQLV